MNRFGVGQPAPQQASVPRYQDQPELAARISADPVFSALEQEVAHERKTQAMKWWYTYVLTDVLDGASSKPFIMTIEQGTDFKCCYMTASVFSFDGTHTGDGIATEIVPTNPTSFPIPNSSGLTYWAGRGLTMRITDTRAGRDLTSGDVPFELFATPGYGLSFVKPFPFHYFFLRNSKIRFDIRNLDVAARLYNEATGVDYGSQHFNIALHGYKYLTPGS
jgi:hypothetical protein